MRERLNQFLHMPEEAKQGSNQQYPVFIALDCLNKRNLRKLVFVSFSSAGFFPHGWVIDDITMCDGFDMVFHHGPVPLYVYSSEKDVRRERDVKERFLRSNMENEHRDNAWGVASLPAHLLVVCPFSYGPEKPFEVISYRPYPYYILYVNTLYRGKEYPALEKLAKEI